MRRVHMLSYATLLMPYLGVKRFTTPGKVKVNIITQDKTHVSVEGNVGQTLMECIRDTAKLDIEAACDGTCACSTCHVYLDEVTFEKLPKPDEDELDMLDLSLVPKPTSRLSCQVTLSAELENMEVTLIEDQQNQLI
eukprot:Tbor_TRINITY_DN5846_c0_g2::TRINITY_DN5846_c0_g2_i1::g.7185::m.7185